MTTAAHTDASVPDLLGTLAADHATGALSTRSGIFYLAAGHVVHVESAHSPDLGDLLTRSGAVAQEGWWEAVERAGARHCVGRRLVDSGRLTTGALELCHLGALFDAAYFALAHDGTALRFRPGVVHWFGAVRPVPVTAVLRESWRRRDLLHRIWPDPAVDTAPLTRVPGVDPADLPPRRGRTFALVDGLVLAHDVPDTEPEGLAALTAAALGVAHRMTDAAGRGDFRELLVRGTQGYIATYAAGTTAVLTLLADDRVNVGRLHLEGRRSGARIAELVDARIGPGGGRPADRFATGGHGAPPPDPARRIGTLPVRTPQRPAHRPRPQPGG